MVRILTNSFALGRIHQAYLLTGVRGVGKTTTARILARALNYERPARDGAPGEDGGRNGSPHSAQKKCCSWYVRFPSSGSSSVMNRSSTITVSQW